MKSQSNNPGTSKPGQSEQRTFMGIFILPGPVPLATRWKVAAVLVGVTAGIAGVIAAQG